MLARKNKIKTILKQRAFIVERLSQIPNNEDGNPAFAYNGHVYFENIKYFENEGYYVWPVEEDEIKTTADAMPVYLFIPRDEALELTEEELEEANNYFLKENSLN